MIIKDATKEDLKELIEMNIEFEKEYVKTQLSENNPTKSLNKNAENKIKENLINDFNSKNKKFILAEDNKTIIGVVVASKISLNGIYNVKEIGKLNFLYVKKDFRRKKSCFKIIR